MIRLKWIISTSVAIVIFSACSIAEPDPDPDPEPNINETALFLTRAVGGYKVKNFLEDLGTSVLDQTMCGGCKAGFGIILLAMKIKNEKELMKIVSTLCIMLKLQTKEVCTGLARVFAPIGTVILKRTKTNPDEICNFLLGERCGDAFHRKYDWKVRRSMVNKPPVVALEPPKAVYPKMKVLQITDTHVDPHYKEGSNARCREPMCCRETNGKVKNPSDGAWKWGDYRYCDPPAKLLDSMLKHIKERHPDIDYIMWTGDIPPHDIWRGTKEEALHLYREAAKTIGDAFPNTPIYPCVGNHEPVPINNFPSPTLDVRDFNMSWLYDELDSHWRRWLPGDTSNTIRYGAYYSVRVRPGFKIISLNSNFCYYLNWWLLLDSVDPGNQLQWLVRELQTAEDNNEKVHIISHIPSGNSDCLKVWSRNYNEIINRYEGTVMAMFYGHTHQDEFQVLYDMEDTTRPIAVNYITPSLSTYNDVNPGYRIFYVEGDHPMTTRQIIDHETWIVNLTYANLHDDPVWYKLYSARSAYNMAGLRPQDWDNLISEMIHKDDVFNLYQRYYYKDSDVLPACNLKCRKTLICDAKSGRSHDRSVLCGPIYNAMEIRARNDWTTKAFTELSSVFRVLFGWMEQNKTKTTNTEME